MFNIGIGEVFVIMVVALLFLGPEKFPVFAKVVMHTYRDFRKYKDEIMREVTRELAPVRKDLQELSRYNPEDYIESLALAVSTEPKEDTKVDRQKGEEQQQDAAATPAPSNPEAATETPPAEDPYASLETAQHPAGTEPRRPVSMDEPYSD